jgi:hypothetical protein
LHDYAGGGGRADSSRWMGTGSRFHWHRHKPILTTDPRFTAQPCNRTTVRAGPRAVARLHRCQGVGAPLGRATRTPFSLPPMRRRAGAPAGRSRSHDSGPLGTADGCLRPTRSPRTAGVARSRRRSNIASASARMLADDARRATERLVRDTYDLLVVPLRTRQPSPIAQPPVAHYLPRRANTGLDTVGFE